jgi:diguanylate cyclase (GGDEF)-like protein/PAS domain S-box-containing protein
MGVRALVVMSGVFALTFILGTLVVRDAVNRTVERQALAVAEIVAAQATTARSVYTREIVGKLSQDGFGPNVDSARMPGHVPIPAQFLKLVGRASSENADKLYEYRPVSKWNLEPTQGLVDDFLRWAWPQLEAQDPTQPVGKIGWKAVSRFEEQEGRRVLRYLSADPASQNACATCHNAYERMPEVIARRVIDGVAPGKQWQQHQLLGALSVTIPLDKAEQLAGTQVGETSIFIFAILVTSFAAMFWFNWRLVRQEKDLNEAERQLAKSELEARNANELLQAKHGVEEAFSELSTFMQAIDQHAIVSVASRDGRILQVNDRMTAITGFSREELLGQDHRILSSHTHEREFFRHLWLTLGQGQTWRGVICNRRKNGSLYWVDSAIVPQRDSAGEVVRYVSIRIDITERMQAEHEMVRLATHDSLTGLANRTLLRDRVQQALETNKRTGMKSAVLFIDLDQFKTINDSLGHEVGDRLLVEVSHRLRDCVRAEDTVARQGGDEFIVFLPRIPDAASAGVLAAKLLRQLAQPMHLDERELFVGSSIGIAVFPEDGEDVDTLLKNSDTAMYQVKEAGRNHFAFFTPDMNAQAFDRYALGTDLRRAAERGEFSLVFQPVVGMTSGRIEGMEALLRWNHPVLGPVAPARFIPLAESLGQIVPIGEWVMRQACLQIRLWRQQGLRVPRLAINLSAIQVHHQGLVDSIREILDEMDVEASCLEFEITEGSLMNKTADVVNTLQALSAMGARIAIDDFGTGYSSLSYLKRLPIDTLKIDRSFVMDIGDDADDTAIVAAVVAMAQSLKLRVIAEGVETTAQREFLRSQGCDQFQGFLFSRPVPPAEMGALLRVAPAA